MVKKSSEILKKNIAIISSHPYDYLPKLTCPIVSNQVVECHNVGGLVQRFFIAAFFLLPRTKAHQFIVRSKAIAILQIEFQRTRNHRSVSQGPTSNLGIENLKEK